MFIKNLFNQRYDAWWLALVVSALLVNPYYLHQQINLFELGLYLPGMEAILNGQIPYRDFICLRGPFELYLPAFFLKIFGNETAVLSTYFYLTTVLTLVVTALTAAQLIKNRLLLWVLIPVLVSRTFPRVVFTYWGGMRYAWGALAIFAAVRFIKSKKEGWIYLAGVFTAIAGLTSIEVGVSSFAAIALSLIFIRPKAVIPFCIANVVIVIPYLIYLFFHQALGHFLNAQWVIATSMTKVFLQSEPVPANLVEILMAMFNPLDRNFQHLTPVYCFLFFLGYIAYRFRRGQLNVLDHGAMAVMLYAFILYATSFRNLWANAFEMALVPEKIVLFFMIQEAHGYLKINYKAWAKFFIIVIVCSSLIFAVTRFQKRFYVGQLLLGAKLTKIVPVLQAEHQQMDLARVRGFVLPAIQAQDFIELNAFINRHTRAADPLLIFPEHGALSFVLNRPFIGRFSITTLAWVDDNWFNQWMADLGRTKPSYVIMNRVLPDHFENLYFKVPANRKKYLIQLDYIEKNYHLVGQTPSYGIYAIN